MYGGKKKEEKIGGGIGGGEMGRRGRVGVIKVGCVCVFVFFFFQAGDGIRDLVRSRGLGDVYKGQDQWLSRYSPSHVLWSSSI